FFIACTTSPSCARDDLPALGATLGAQQPVDLAALRVAVGRQRLHVDVGRGEVLVREAHRGDLEHAAGERGAQRAVVILRGRERAQLALERGEQQIGLCRGLLERVEALLVGEADERARGLAHAAALRAAALTNVARNFSARAGALR